jgi:hypothetical protein
MATGLICMWRESAIWGGFYLLLVVLGSVLILFAYCAKCPCRSEACGHVVPGLLAHCLPDRVPGSYGFLDYLGVAAPLFILIAVPLPWLRSYPAAMALFGILLAVGGTDILMYVCKGCGNQHCPLRKIRN